MLFLELTEAGYDDAVPTDCAFARSFSKNSRSERAVLPVCTPHDSPVLTRDAGWNNGRGTITGWELWETRGELPVFDRRAPGVRRNDGTMPTPTAIPVSATPPRWPLLGDTCQLLGLGADAPLCVTLYPFSRGFTIAWKGVASGMVWAPDMALRTWLGGRKWTASRGRKFWLFNILQCRLALVRPSNGVCKVLPTGVTYRTPGVNWCALISEYCWSARWSITEQLSVTMLDSAAGEFCSEWPSSVNCKPPLSAPVVRNKNQISQTDVISKWNNKLSKRQTGPRRTH